MSFADLLAETLRTLGAHKLRTALTMFGIAWGIVSIVLMVAAGEGLRDGHRKVAEGFGRDILVVYAGRTSLQAGGTRAGRRIQWTATDHLRVQAESPSCREVLPELGQVGIPVRSAHNNASLVVTGSLPPFAGIRSIGVAEGRYPGWDDEREARRVALLGSDAKKQLFGSRPAVGETIRIPFATVLRDFPSKPPALPDAVDRLIVTPRQVEDHEACQAEVRRALARLHGFDPADKEAAAVLDTVEQAKAFRTMTDGMKRFLGAVGVATLFIGGIGVMNVMLVAVRERTREIGIRRALGATRRSVVRQFFTGLVPTWQSGVLAFALLGTVAVLSALYPSSRAAAVDPIAALRFEAGG